MLQWILFGCVGFYMSFIVKYNKPYVCTMNRQKNKKLARRFEVWSI